MSVSLWVALIMGIGWLIGIKLADWYFNRRQR